MTSLPQGVPIFWDDEEDESPLLSRATTHKQFGVSSCTWKSHVLPSRFERVQWRLRQVDGASLKSARIRLSIAVLIHCTSPTPTIVSEASGNWFINSRDFLKLPLLPVPAGPGALLVYECAIAEWDAGTLIAPAESSPEMMISEQWRMDAQSQWSLKVNCYEPDTAVKCVLEFRRHSYLGNYTVYPAKTFPCLEFAKHEIAMIIGSKRVRTGVVLQADGQMAIDTTVDNRDNVMGWAVDVVVSVLDIWDRPMRLKHNKSHFLAMSEAVLGTVAEGLSERSEKWSLYVELDSPVGKIAIRHN